MDDHQLREIPSNALRRYMHATPERDYLLIDVRQPAEYAAGHIPGALALPLPELEGRLFELPADRDLVFYCRTGARSQIAAILCVEAEITQHPVYNLRGGFLAWDGRRLSEVPRVQVFDPQADAAALMMTAMDLEKGAYRYYHQVLAVVGDAAFRPTIEVLSRAEEAHARMIHALWQRERPEAEDFETLFARLPGEILEGGQPLAEVLAQLTAVKAPGCLGIMELSLEIEYRAYDLYRTMAARVADARERDSFNAIAQAEKQHMRVLTEALAQCT